MFFNLGLSRFVLKKDLKWEQIAGAMLVVAGVIAAAWPSESGGGVFAKVSLPGAPQGYEPRRAHHVAVRASARFDLFILFSSGLGDHVHQASTQLRA